MVVVIAQPKEGLNMASCTRRKNQTAKVDTVAQPIEHLTTICQKEGSDVTSYTGSKNVTAQVDTVA
jgi:hypothetical protein